MGNDQKVTTAEGNAGNSVFTNTDYWCNRITVSNSQNGQQWSNAGRYTVHLAARRLMILLTLLSLGGQIMNTYLSSRIAYDFSMRLRQDIYTKVLQFSKYEYERFGTSSLITRNTNDVTQVQSLVEMGLKFLIIAPLYLLGGIGLTYSLSPKLSLIFIAVIPFLTAGTILIYKFANPLYEKMQKWIDRLNLLFREGLTGVKVIRAFNRQAEDYNKYQTANLEYTKTAIAAGTIMSAFTPFITLLLNLTTVIILWVGAGSVSQGTMEVGTIMGTISYSAQILMGFAILTNVILAIPRGQISIQRIHEILHTPLSIGEPEVPALPDNSSLKLEHVDFRYPGAKKQALTGIQLNVQTGQTLAIIGSTGSGKSSLVNLLNRLYDVDNGTIRMADVDIRDIPLEELHSRISLAPQRSTLFMGTICDNMKMANPVATDAEIWQALDLACATEFVIGLPDGLDSTVEKNGGNFSGGQKQRLSIARTLLKPADIYIFDDTFSALDYKTDAAVRAGMKRHLVGAIVIIIAQRVSTVIAADQIAVLDDGRLTGVGTHEQLLADNSVYQEVVESQIYREGTA